MLTSDIVVQQAKRGATRGYMRGDMRGEGHDGSVPVLTSDIVLQLCLARALPPPPTKSLNALLGSCGGMSLTTYLVKCSDDGVASLALCS